MPCADREPERLITMERVSKASVLFMFDVAVEDFGRANAGQVIFRFVLEHPFIRTRIFGKNKGIIALHGNARMVNVLQILANRQRIVDRNQ